MNSSAWLWRKLYGTPPPPRPNTAVVETPRNGGNSRDWFAVYKMFPSQWTPRTCHSFCNIPAQNWKWYGCFSSHLVGLASQQAAGKQLGTSPKITDCLSVGTVSLNIVSVITLCCISVVPLSSVSRDTQTDNLKERKQYLVKQKLWGARCS